MNICKRNIARLINKFTAGLADLHTGKLDVAFPVGGELWNAEQDGIFSSSPVVVAGVDLGFVGSFDDKTVASIAVN